jgi:hypothetical protein
MLACQRNFNDVYGGRLAGPGEGGPFSENIPFMDFRDPESWDRLHSNTITIKPYPDKVSSDPATGKLDLPVVGRNRQIQNHRQLPGFIYRKHSLK